MLAENEAVQRAADLGSGPASVSVRPGQEEAAQRKEATETGLEERNALNIGPRPGCRSLEALISKNGDRMLRWPCVS